VLTMEIDSITCMDCVEYMAGLPDKCTDLIICDLPYGSVECKWDTQIPLEPLWNQYKRITKGTAAVLLFGSEPFSTKLRMSNLSWYKYDWIWRKDVPTGFQHAKNMPLKDFEIVSVFSGAPIGHASLLGIRRMYYNPQGLEDCYVEVNGKSKFKNIITARPSHKDKVVSTKRNYPRMVLEYPSQSGELSQGRRLHPTQKPVELYEYFIRTYTEEGAVVLDCCCGVGTLAIAAIRSDRHYLCCDNDQGYVDIAKKRVEKEVDSRCL
jgi:site-specific DNA-methyltransferase (adenine-specific)